MAKGTDRRAAYTRSVIKEALLALKKSMPFDEITVSALCREAGIHRGTFYLHYRNTMEVLDEVLDDALDNVRDLPSHLSGGSDGCRCGYPLCRFLRESEKYRPVLMDDALAGHVIDRIAERSRAPFLAYMRPKSALTDEQLEAVLLFQLNGCFAISKKCGGCGDQRWRGVQEAVDHFIRGGLDACGLE